MGYQLIETVTVGSGGAASIEFTGIPQDATSLVLVISQRNETTSGAFYIQINNDTSTSNYPGIWLEGNGSSAYSYPLTANAYIRLRPNRSGDTANTFSNSAIYFSNYTATSTKSISIDTVTEGNDAAEYQGIIAARYLGTSGISVVTMTAGTGNVAQHSTASIYKITAD
jgi:hypothetical protein